MTEQDGTREVPGEASYTVTAAMVVARCGPDWHDEYLHRGQVLPPLVDQQQLEHLLATGMVAPIRGGRSS